MISNTLHLPLITVLLAMAVVPMAAATGGLVGGMTEAREADQHIQEIAQSVSQLESL